MNNSNTTKPRLGLALSGGGFRASFFHIGVLARMAETGLLSQVQVISTVSGGSIIGAMYYLHVKKLLEKPEYATNLIPNVEYIKIVRQIECDFLRAVQKNLRVRVFSNPWKTLLMCKSNYSRSDRMAQLYDHYFYRPVLPGRDGGPVQMRDLRITPDGSPANYNPLQDPPLANIVPIILINATALNTGHNWRFEAVTMGEPEPPKLLREVQEDIDRNMHLGRPDNYDAMIKTQQDVELGTAVAASAGVPGLFAPMAISHLYQDSRVQLVDGGVHDNQGIEGLLEKECTDFIVSDASGQMEDQRNPETQIVNLLLRSDSIQSDRIREEELLRLWETHKDNMALLHLRRGVPADSKQWIGSDGLPRDAKKKSTTAGGATKQPDRSEKFHVDEAVQDRLARLRTDLDTFTDVEAYSLMLDGYLMSSEYLQGAGAIEYRMKAPAAPSGGWKFQQIAQEMKTPSNRYKRQLGIGKRLLFKVLWLYPKTSIVLGVLLATAVIRISWNPLARLISEPGPATWTISSRGLFYLCAGILALFLLSSVRTLRQWFKSVPRDPNVPGHPFKSGVGFVVLVVLMVVTSPFALCAFIIARAHLLLFNGFHVNAGRIEKFR